MIERVYGDHIEDIYNAINDIQSFIKDMSYEDFTRDRKTFLAVVKAIEIIGEAIKNIPSSVKNKYSSIPWRDISNMRNKLTHEYFGIDFKVLWDTATIYIPKLKSQIEVIKKELINE